MYKGYLVYGTTEIANNARTYAYQMAGCIQDGTIFMRDPGAENLPLIVDDPGTYSTPSNDLAPWYDPAYPESADAAGVWIESISGFDKLGSRDITPTVDGSIASRRNLSPKTLTVTAWLGGSTCCSTQYLYRWLQSKLMERDCNTGEEVSQLSLYDCCPTDSQVSGLTDEQIIEEYLRVGYRVKVVSDLEKVEEHGTCCDSLDCSTNIRVQWTFLLENPRFYRNVNLCADEVPWPTDIECMQVNCDPCPTETTVELPLTLQKTRLPIAVNADGTYCTLGWTPGSTQDDLIPENSWVDVATVEEQSEPLFINLSYNKTWDARNWDPTTIDICSADIQIGIVCEDTDYAGLGEHCTNVASQPQRLGITLTTTDSSGGTWEEYGGWSLGVNEAFPPEGAELYVHKDCACVETETEAQITLNPDLTWDPYGFTYTGSLPPVGYSGIRVRRQAPGTYKALVTLPESEAFSGMRGITAPDPYVGISPAYCQPLEWVQDCCKIEFTSGVERAEPYLEFYSGSDFLYNFKADFYALESADDTCLCDLSDPEAIANWLCREPIYSVQFGTAIPSESTVVFDPRDRSISIHRGGRTYDASSFASGLNGATPYFIEFPDCFGVCVVVSAEVHLDELPANDSYFSVGHVPFTYVGI